MPYLQASWISMVRPAEANKGQTPGGGSGDAKGGRSLRTQPHGSTLTADDGPKKQASTHMDHIRVQCVANIVKSQVEELQASTPSQTTEDEAFYRYSISVDMVVFTGTFSNIYLAHHQDHPEYALIARVYEPTAKIDATRSTYMKILKHLGKRHHSLIGTWDIFFDLNGRVVIFQEFALHGNMQEYIKQNNVFVPEAQMAEWARHIYRGMDFLGDAGVCHRAINPKHILLTPSMDETDKTLAKLGSFRDAIVYYDSKEGAIRYQACRPVDKRAQFPYQAPEVFGDPAQEEYDPIVADVWSFGATFFVACARTYPCRYRQADVAAEIQKTVEQARNLSPEAKRWFAGLLRADASHRTTFDKIESDPWYKSFQP